MIGCFSSYTYRPVLQAMGINIFKLNVFYEQALYNDHPPQRKIPYILHQVWTGLENADGSISQMGIQYEKNLLNNLKHFNAQWKIFLWTNHPDTIPLSIQANPQVEIKIYTQEFSELNVYFDILSRNVGLLSLLANIIRAKALIEYGGVYFDLDYKLCKKIDHLITQYDFIAGQESGTHIVAGNAFIASHKGHPVIQDYLMDMIDNFSQDTANEVVMYACNFVDWRLLGFGPHALTFSFIQNAFIHGNKDIVFRKGILLDYRRDDGYNIDAEDFCSTLPESYYGNDPMKGDWTGAKGQIEALGELYTCKY